MYDHIRGQDNAIARLKTLRRLGRVAHAYLFTGPPGVGKDTTAKAFAGALLCEAGSETGAACGLCRQCRLFYGAAHPDLHLVAPEGASIGIDQIRHVNAAVSRKPYNRRHVVVINAADLCTDQAQNAFLKTLEEPPGAVVFILVSDRAEALLPTVLSRCCEVKFRRLKPEMVAEELVKRHDVPPAEAKAVAALAGGSIGRALELHSPETAALRKKVLALAASPALARVNDKTLFTSRAEVWQWLDFMSLWYRDLLLYRLTGDAGLVVNTDYLQEIQKAAYAAPQLLGAVEAVETGKKMLRANVHQRLVMEGLTARLASILTKAR